MQFPYRNARILQNGRTAAEGKATKLSDLGLAVVLDKTTPQSKYHETRLLLLDQLGRVINNRPLDIAILNDASPLLAHVAVTKGKAIFCQDDDSRAAFQVKTLKEFDDAIYLRSVYYHYLEERVRENRLGETHER
ncbi:MAG: nucleotidyltransferase domain-containing protein [Chloroflexi bacterium]|nr:nucleotidyltransferase domain-containing protein [Chloroflexota bacterium]